MTFKEFVKRYLRQHGQISFKEAQELHGCAPSSLSSRITKMRNEGWEITHQDGYYVLKSEPTDDIPPTLISVSIERLQELKAVASLIVDDIDDLLND